METTLGGLIRTRRRELGLTQEGLAERASLSVQAVGALERGDRRRPRADTVSRLADALRLAGQRRTDFVVAARRQVNGTVAEQTAAGSAADHPRPGPSPRQLPPDVPHFVGRKEAIGTIVGLLERPAGPVPAVAGMAGVGKTALAVHVAHLVAARFPDGQLYLNLRGYGGGEPMRCRDAVGHLLLALGEPVDDLPTDTERAAAWYRSGLAGRRALLVLDNVASVEQIAPLLPGTAGSRAIVTSRRALAALPQLHHLPLDVLCEREAVALLAAVVGPSRIAAEPDAAAAVVRQCGRLPLAVQLASARLAARPQWPVSHLRARLDHEHRRLDELVCGEVGVRASLAVSIEQLLDSADQRDRRAVTAYVTLGVPDLSEISLPVATRLRGAPAATVEQELEHLVDLSLLEAVAPGRYHLHDLLRVHAHELAVNTLPADERAAALIRVLELYVAAAWRCQTLTSPRSARTQLGEPDWTAGSPALRDANEALTWLDEHRRHLLGVVRQAARNPLVPPDLFVRLAVGMFSFYASRRHAKDWSAVCQLAIERGVDPVLRAMARMDLGLALGYLAGEGRADWDDCLAHLNHSLDEFEALGRGTLVAACLMNLATVLEAKGDLAEAIHHAERGLTACQVVSDHHGQAAVHLILGELHRQAGANDQALRHYHDCHGLAEGVGFRYGVGGALHGIGIVHRNAGRHRESLLFLRRGVALFRQIGDPDGETPALRDLATAHLALADHDAALTCLRRAVDLATRYGYHQRLTQLRHQIGIALAGVGRIEEARQQWTLALSDYERHDHDAAADVRTLLAGLDRSPRSPRSHSR